MVDQVRRIERQFTGATSRKMRKLTLDITADLIGETPVRFGWARANWVPSIGDPFVGPAGAPNEIDQGPQVQGIAEVAATYKLSDGPIWITNFVPYIQRLNEGYSRQAPSGYVDEIIDRNVDSLSPGPL